MDPSGIPLPVGPPPQPPLEPVQERREPAGPPEFRREFENLIPQFNGDPLILSKYIKQCDKLYIRFHDTNDVDNFQNEVLMGVFISKLGPSIADKVFVNTVDTYPQLRQALLQTFGDKRDTYTLTLELGKLKQEVNEDCFRFHDRVAQLLNAQIAYLQVHEAEGASILTQYMQILALRVFLNGLQDPLGNLLRTKSPENLGAALGMLVNDFNLKPKDKIVPVNKNNLHPVMRPVIQRHPTPQFAPRSTPQYLPRMPMQQFQRPPFAPRPFPSQSNRPPQNQYRPNFSQNSSQNKNWSKPSNFKYKEEPMSISTRNTNFNMITQVEPENVEPENAQYYDNSSYDNPYYDNAQYYDNPYEIDQMEDQVGSLSLEPVENNQDSDFLGVPPKSSSS